MKKQSWSERINERLKEAPGEIFSRGKWRFWFPLVLGLTLLNGLLTAWIFGGAGAQVWIGVAVATVGALLCWLAVGNLHYSDSEDSRLSRGVSFLDSATLIFMIAHFCFLFWAQGHLITLRAAEADYAARAEALNLKTEKISADNVAIARSAERVAEHTTRAEKLRNDTAYQQRRAAEAGARIGSAPGAGALSPALSTAPIELERPEKPKESSVVFLSEWDRWIRLANFGELILAAVTLIYIRNRSAAFNVKNAATVNLGARRGLSAPVAALRQEGRKIATPVATGVESDLDRLRGHLKAIAFYHPGRWFKVDPLEAGDGLWIRFCERRKGRERTIAKAKWNNKVFAELDRPDFKERLIRRLVDAGFPIGEKG